MSHSVSICTLTIVFNKKSIKIHKNKLIFRCRSAICPFWTASLDWAPNFVSTFTTGRRPSCWRPPISRRRCSGWRTSQRPLKLEFKKPRDPDPTTPWLLANSFGPFVESIDHQKCEMYFGVSKTQIKAPLENIKNKNSTKLKNSTALLQFKKRHWPAINNFGTYCGFHKPKLKLWN